MLLCVSAVLAAPRTAHLSDYHSGAALPNVFLRVFDVAADGTRTLNAVAFTGLDGSAELDVAPAGLTETQVVTAFPYGMEVAAPLSEVGTSVLQGGAVVASVLHGLNGKPIRHQSVTLMEVDERGGWIPVKALHTDAVGSVVMDPAVAGDARYRLRVPSPVDGSLKLGPVFSAPDKITFSVGGPPVDLRVVDDESLVPFPDLRVWIYELSPEGLREPRGWRETDADGRVRLDLDGIESGRRYVLRFKPINQWIERVVDASTAYVVRAGVVRVEVLDARDGAPIPSKEITLLRVMSDGSYQFEDRVESAADGTLRLDPAALGVDDYVLQTTSPLDGSLTYSESIKRKGDVTFTLGGGGLLVRVVDRWDATRLAGTRVRIQRELDGGGRELVHDSLTNSSGELLVDLPGLGDGSVYWVQALAHGQWLERSVAAPGLLAIETGAFQVTLTSGAEPRDFAGVSVHALLKRPDGSLTRISDNVVGLDAVVRFDPGVLEEGESVVFRAIDPVGDGVDYLGAPVIAAGKYDLVITPGMPLELDTKRPELRLILTPDARVSEGGFRVVGYATDAELANVSISVRGPAGQFQRVNVAPNSSNGRFDVVVDAPWYVTGDDLVIEVAADDAAMNRSSARFSAAVVPDHSPPIIRVRSHADAAVIAGRGTLIWGKVTDDVDAPAVVAGVLRAPDGSVLAERSLEVEVDEGRWAWALPEDLLTGQEHVMLELSATDLSGNVGATSHVLQIDQDDELWRHLAARMSFGATSKMLDDARTSGVSGFVDAQLSAEDSALEAELASLPVENLGDLRFQMLVRCVRSKAQLRELMTWFWENHFNTDLRRHGNVAWEMSDNKAFREHAFGRYRDLLEISAKSPAMLMYLDGFRNIAKDPNENYARELLELHTTGRTDLGLDVITEVARVFTGWTIEGDAFKFADEDHDFGAKSILGQGFPDGVGMSEGNRLLDQLARRSDTAEHLCDKLIRFFLTEKPEPELKARCAAIFVASSDSPHQMARVLSALLKSSEFRDPSHRGNQLKRPLHFVVGLIRDTDAMRAGNDVHRELASLGQEPFSYAVPTGYSLEPRDWISSHHILQRLRLVARLFDSWPLGDALHADAVAMWTDAPVGTAEGMAATVLERVLNGRFSQAELATAMAVLTDDGTRYFDHLDANAEVRLARLVRVALSLPSYGFH